MDLDEHEPTRPTWNCRACGRDWPCVPARKALTGKVDSDDIDSQFELCIVMWSYLERFVLDVGPVPEALERFIDWTRPIDIRLMGTAEITRRLGISRQRAHQITNLPTFPTPVASLQLGRIWAARDVEEWVAEHRPRDINN
jgi:predicted DNA-binding transcriptional regulator AlpA